MSPQTRPITIAVLPFENISPNQDFNHFVAGFTEDLITDLSRYSSLRVISKHSTSLVLAEDPNSDEMISSLQADYLVKGSFRQKGDQLRINAQLIQGSDGSILWSQRHDNLLEDIFDMIDDLVEQLVSALQRQVDISLLASSKKKPRTSLAAYEYWLLGMEELKKGSLDTDNAAREFFMKALEVDPNYARAYAGLSLSYFNEWSCQFWERWDYSQKGAYEYAQKAVDLDESNYISMTVLGRLFVYKGDWERAEHYLRKSLRLNPNDADNLINIASCFIHLDYLDEAEKLYLKALKLNPMNTDWYYSFASMLYFERGEFEKCIELGLKTNFDAVMVDMSAFISGAYYYLGDYDKMHVFWKKYLKMFQKKILRGNALNEEEALNWVKNVNPHNDRSNLIEFLQHLAKQSNLVLNNGEEEKETKEHTKLVNRLVFNDPLWELKFDGIKAALPDAKGIHDIAKLMAQPREEIHCMELMGAVVETSETEYAIDQQAKKAYQHKMVELQEDIAEASSMNDQVRHSMLSEEYDQLVDELSRSLGLQGRSRKLPAEVDKARSAVTWRIRSAIKKIKEVHPNLADHLTHSIKTGTFCYYTPANVIQWEL